MIYSRDVAAAIQFYAGALGLKLLEEFKAGDRTVYARLKSPGSDTTIALHMAGPGEEVVTGGVRLYFEIEDLDDFCKRLADSGVKFSKLPTIMPWGWKH